MKEDLPGEGFEADENAIYETKNDDSGLALPIEEISAKDKQ